MDSPTIAIVTANAATADSIEARLVSAGYQVDRTPPGRMAYDSIRETLPALVILEIDDRAPALGWKTLQLMWLDRTTRPIPIIVCTTETGLAVHLTGRGCALVEKPLAVDSLLTTVMKVLIDQPSDIQGTVLQ